MQPRTTLLLLLLVLALGAVILGIERYLPSTLELREMKRGPVKFDRAAITQIEIDSSGGDGVGLAREDGVWWVRRPFNDHAGPERIAKLLAELLAIGWIERVHREEFDEAGWAKTGLEQPRHKLRLMAGGACALELWLGAPAPIEGSHYLALLPSTHTSEKACYVAKTLLPELLKPASKEWRDSKLMRLPADQVLGLKLIQAGGQMELVRADAAAPWMLVKPLSTRGSKEKVGELLSTLLNLEIKEAAEVAGGAGKEAAPADAEMTEGELRISVASAGADKPVEIVLHKPAAGALETTATISRRKPVFTVQAKGLRELWAQPNDLRDRMLARIDEDAVGSIRIESRKFAPILLEKQSESWFLRRHGRLEAANGDRVARFFESLNTHSIREFTSDSAANVATYGLDQPFLAVSWTEGAGKPVKLQFGASLENAEFYAKYDHEPSVYRIDASLLPSIPQDGIKWKGLGALRFTQFALRRISLAAGTAPAIVLHYDPTTAQWKGERAGRDITPMLDRVKADKLAGALAKFNVQDWSADATAAIPALQKPALRVVVSLGEPGTNSGPTRDVVLNFAPTQEGMDTALYFGQVNGGPDVFYVTRTALLELLAPVFKDEAPAAR